MAEAREPSYRQEDLLVRSDRRAQPTSPNRHGEHAVERDAMEERPVVGVNRGLHDIMERCSDHAYTHGDREPRQGRLETERFAAENIGRAPDDATYDAVSLTVHVVPPFAHLDSPDGVEYKGSRC